jgi:hypothetical protein
MSNFFSIEVQELSRFSNVYSLDVKWFTSIKDIKDQLHKLINCPPSRIRLYHFSSAKSLSNTTTLHDMGINDSGHIFLLLMDVRDGLRASIIPSKDMDVDNKCKKILTEVRLGLQRNKVPSKTDLLDCTGGVYFMKAASGAQVAVFKPSDEEQGMPNNPKGHAGNGDHGLRDFLKPGRGYIRETAAYILDHMNFSCVPPTTIVHCEHPTLHYPSRSGQPASSNQIFPKIGSLQAYIRANDTFDDISSSMISVFELQKIALLDMRLLNNDRNSSNILAINRAVPPSPSGSLSRRSRSESVASMDDESPTQPSDEFIIFADEFEAAQKQKNKNKTYLDAYELIPIDHGYCIPSQLHIDEYDWAWFDCPQIDEKVDPAIYRYIMSLDIDTMTRNLTKQLSISDEAVFLLRLSHHLIVVGVSAGLSLKRIARMIARTDEERPSPLENVISVAADNAHRAIEMRSGRLNSRSESKSAPFGRFSSREVSPDVSTLRTGPTPSGSPHPSISPYARSERKPAAGSRYKAVSTVSVSGGSKCSVDRELSNYKRKAVRGEGNSRIGLDLHGGDGAMSDESGNDSTSRGADNNSAFSSPSPFHSSSPLTHPEATSMWALSSSSSSMSLSPKTGMGVKKVVSAQSCLDLSSECDRRRSSEQAEYFLQKVDDVGGPIYGDRDSDRKADVDFVGDTDVDLHSESVEGEGVSVSSQLSGKPLISLQTLDPSVLRSCVTKGKAKRDTKYDRFIDRNREPIFGVSQSQLIPDPDGSTFLSHYKGNSSPAKVPTVRSRKSLMSLLESESATTSECSSSYEKGSPKSIREFMKHCESFQAKNALTTFSTHTSSSSSPVSSSLTTPHRFSDCVSSLSEKLLFSPLLSRQEDSFTALFSHDLSSPHINSNGSNSRATFTTERKSGGLGGLELRDFKGINNSFFSEPFAHSDQENDSQCTNHQSKALSPPSRCFPQLEGAVIEMCHAGISTSLVLKETDEESCLSGMVSISDISSNNSSNKSERVTANEVEVVSKDGSSITRVNSRNSCGSGPHELNEKNDLSVAATAGGNSALLQRRRVNSQQQSVSAHQQLLSDLQPLSLTRVVSLGAFESPAIYDTTKSERQTTRLRRDKRKNAVNTSDFQELRLTFAFEAVVSLVAKETKAMLATKG